MVVEVYLQRETGIPSNDVFVDIDGTITTYNLSLAEQAMLISAVAAMQLEDDTNLGWLIETTKSATYIAITMKVNGLNTATIFDKGGNVFEDSPIYTDLNDLVTSILNVFIP